MTERIEARRRRFLDAAIALFARLGYHSATVPMILKEAQSSIGAFYLYFRNKEDVYVAALKEIDQRLSEALTQEMAREHRGEQKMSAAVKGLVRWLAGNPPETRLLMEAAALGGRMEQARRSIVESHIRSVASALERVAPRFDAGERAVLARCWVGSVLEATLGWIAMPPEERMDAERLAAIVAGFNLRGADLGIGNSAG